MRITWGATRFVVLTRTRAIKIARIRLLWIVPAVLRQVYHGTVRRKIREYAGPTRKPLVWRFLAGVRANRLEHAFYLAHPDYPLMPVIGIYCRDWILIMPRGKPDGDIPDSLHRNAVVDAFLARDVFAPQHWCTYNGQDVLVDYGDDRVEPTFEHCYAA